MEVALTCRACGSGISIYPSLTAEKALCRICRHPHPVCFEKAHLEGRLTICPSCGTDRFYSQRDFNRKLGVLLFLLSAVLSIWTYGISLVLLWILDLILYKRLPSVAVCYKCQAVFRKTANIDEIPPYDHEANDRITYGEAKG